MAAFVWGEGGEATSPEDIALRRKMAQALIAQGTDTSPVQHWAQGAARVAQAIMGGLDERGIRQDIAAGRASDTANLAALSGVLGGGTAAPAGVPAPATGATAGGPVAPPEQIKAIIDANVPEADRDFAYRMADKESRFNPAAVSQTGAKGLFQFTGGTGRDYDLVGRGWDIRTDPEANTKGFVRLTEANRATLRNALGREPTYGELAVAHQQGAGGAISLLTGKGTVDPANLAVQAGKPKNAADIMSYYGYGPAQVASAAPAATPAGPVAPPMPVPAGGYIAKDGAGNPIAVDADGNSILAPKAPAGPVRVASADPTFVPQSGRPAVAPPSVAPVVAPPAAVAPAVASPAPIAPPVVAPAGVDPGNPIPPAPAVQRVAQAIAAAPTAPAAAPAPGVQAVAQAMAPQPQVSAAIKALNNPWASEATKTVAKAIISKSMADPNERIKTQLEIDRMRAEAADQPLKSEGLRLGNAKTAADLADQPIKSEGLRIGNAKSAWELENAQRNAPLDTALKRKQLEKSDATTAIQEYEYAQQRDGETRPFAQWLLENKKAGASQVSIDQKAESKFDQEIASKQAALFSGMAEGAVEGKGDVSRINQLRGIIGQLPGGFLGNAEVLATQAGIRLGPNASKIEAANAIISSLVPAQRTPGSGTTSDRDLEMFKSAVPRLTNTPTGNTLILDTMQAMAEYKQKQGEIATEVITGAKTRQQAMKELQSLPDPFAAFKAAQGKDGSPSPSTGSAAPSGFKILKVE